MKLKELLSKVENVGYLLREENGNEIEFDKLTQAEEDKLMEQNVISFDVVKNDLDITIEMPKSKEKQTFTPKFNLGQEVYFCPTLICMNATGKYRVTFHNDVVIQPTKINGVKFTQIGVQYDVGCKSTRLVCEGELFETKEEIKNFLNENITKGLEQLEDIE